MNCESDEESFGVIIYQKEVVSWLEEQEQLEVFSFDIKKVRRMLEREVLVQSKWGRNTTQSGMNGDPPCQATA